MTLTREQLKASYDWEQAFTYAEGFTIDDVAKVHGSDDGENDGAEWVIWGQLRDKQWFYLHAGCDYTGWDCQASGHSYTADTKKELVRMGMDFGARQRFNLLLPGEGAKP